jgi:hypothetical protein
MTTSSDRAPPGDPQSSYKSPAQTMVGSARLIYGISMLALSIAVTVTVWPGSTTSQGPAATVPTELRYVLVAASGGALGTTLRAILALTDTIGTRQIQREPLLRQLIGFLWAVPISVLSYVVLRGFILSSAAPIQDLNPFGVLVFGFGVGLFSDAGIARLAAVARVLFVTDPFHEDRIDRISDALGITTLDNYRGTFCLDLLDAEGQRTQFEGGQRARLDRNKQYELQAWFQPNTYSGVLSQEINISGGRDTESVDFLIVPDSNADIRFLPGQEVLSLDPRRTSGRTGFRFVTPVTAAPYRLSVRVTQKNRLVAVIAFDVNFEEETG